MNNTDQHIQQLYHDRLGAKELAPEPGTWDDLEKKLRKKTFFIFNPFRFNIWYLSLIVTCTGVLTMLYFYDAPEQNDMNQQQTNSPIIHVIDTLDEDSVEKTPQKNKQYPAHQQAKSKEEKDCDKKIKKNKTNSTSGKTGPFEHNNAEKDSTDSTGINSRKNKLNLAEKPLEDAPVIDSIQAMPFKDTLIKNEKQLSSRPEIKKKNSDTTIIEVDTVKINEKMKKKVIRLR